MAHWRRPAATGLGGVGDTSYAAQRAVRAATLQSRSASSMRRKVLIEKIVLVTVVSVVFQQILPGLEANGIQTALFITLAIMATDFLLRWMLRRFGVPRSPGVDLLVTASLNFCFVLLFQLVIPIIPPEYNLGSVLVFASLITLFVTLYDHYRPAYDIRRVDAREVVNGTGLSVSESRRS
jgi:hypothetical protein